MRARRERTTTPLPSVREVFAAPERAILSALEATLQITTRTLRAEYPGLDRHGRLLPQDGWEPYVPPQVPLVEQIVGATDDLLRLLAAYRDALDRALAEDHHVAGHEHHHAAVPDRDDPF